MTMQVMPPGDGLHTTITVNGRSYSCPLGSQISVPDQDGQVMLANGWIASSVGGAGATANRPANPQKGSEFHDTTVGAIVRWDGKAWRHSLTGASV